MFKNKFNLRNVVAIAICLAGTTMFSGCEKDNNDKELKNTVLENEYLTIQNGTIHQGTIPFSTSGISIADDININRNALAGGSSFVSISTEQKISEIYVGVKGVDYYYSMIPQNQNSLQGMLRAEEETNYSFVILFSQNFDESCEIQVSAKLEDGSLTNVYSVTVKYIKAGTGDLQINLSFDNEKDIDLYVVQPDGEIIYFANRGNYEEEDGEPTGWGLDIDSNAMCDIDGINSENIFYSNEFIQPGKYEVWVNMYANCNRAIPTNWVVTALHETALVSATYGKNPAHGVFPVNTPSNAIGSSLNGATKVMEFTLPENFLRSNKINNTVRTPITESAKAKLRGSSEIIEE